MSDQTLSAADSRAKTSATRAIKRASQKEHVPVCGPNTPGSLAWYDRVTSSWRTWQRCFIEGLAGFSETWPRAGMTRNGTAYLLPPLVPLTDVTGCSSLPTPTANDAKNATLPVSQRDRDSIIGHVIRVPTPKASDAERGGRGELLALVRGKKTRQNWPGMVPTPRAADGMQHRIRSKDAVLKLMDSQGCSKPSRLEDEIALTDHSGGYLNPEWIEWLMGFPLRWTDLEDSETLSSRKSPNGSDVG